MHCPHCSGNFLACEKGEGCVNRGRWARSESAQRLWLAADDMTPKGFDASAANRLTDLVLQDHFWLRERRRLVSHLLQRLCETRPRRWVSALELGCGTGLMLSLLENVAQQVVALDGHRVLLEQAYQRSSFATLMQADATNTMIPTGCFDLVTAFDVIEHVDGDAFLTEARRLVREDGDLLISAPAFPSLWSNMDVQAGHRCRYRWRQLKIELERNGWRPLGYTHFQFLLFPFVYASRRLGGRTPRLLERRPSRTVDRFLGAIDQLEVNLLSDLSLPFGSSLFAWARAEK